MSGTADMAQRIAFAREPPRRQATGPVPDTTSRTLVGAVDSVTADGATVYSDEHSSYGPLTALGYAHETVKHSAEEYVRGEVHTNTIESFWSMFKRGYIGTYHYMSRDHLHRYLAEFAGRHNIRELDTSQQMETLVRNMAGKRLTYTELIGADDG